MALSYTPPFLLLWEMPFPDDDEPEWKRTGVAVEFWVLNAVIAGALIYGAFLTLTALL